MRPYGKEVRWVSKSPAMEGGDGPEKGMPVKLTLLRWKPRRKERQGANGYCSRQLLVHAFRRKVIGKTNVGTLQVRFDEGGGCKSSLLLYPRGLYYGVRR